MTGATTKTGLTVRRASVAAAALCLIKLVLALLLGPEALRLSLVAGVVAGAAGGFLGLWFVARALPGGLNEMLKAVVFGFLVRALFVGAGLLFVLRTPGGAPLAFVATFFPLFFVFAALEALVAAAHAKRTPAA